MKPCWKELGLTEEGAAQAEAVIDRMVTLITDIGNRTVVNAVLEEALFRGAELPKRTPAFQAWYKQENNFK